MDSKANGASVLKRALARRLLLRLAAPRQILLPGGGQLLRTWAAFAATAFGAWPLNAAGFIVREGAALALIAAVAAETAIRQMTPCHLTGEMPMAYKS